jgi:putative FmdB family regulatory protein
VPTYEYVCPRCRKAFEIEQRITDALVSRCLSRDCDGKPERVIPRATSFALKGSGWFRDGY